MMHRSKRVNANVLATVAASALVIGTVVACGSTTEPGELVVAVDTNVPLPLVVDTVSLQITAGDGITYPYEFPVGDKSANPKNVELPATLGVVAGSAAGDTVRVRLMGLHDGSVVTLRDTTTTVPGDRTALFRVTLDGLCYGAVSVRAGTEQSTVDGGMPNASDGCGSGATCILGGCQPNRASDSYN